MIVSLTRGRSFDTADRFDAWCEAVRDMPCPHRIRTDHADDFRFTLRMAALGAAAMAHTRVPSLHAARTPRLIRQRDEGTYKMELCGRGRLGAEHAGREFLASAGQWVVHDSSRPHALWSVPDGPSQAAFALVVPKSVLGLSDTTVAPLLNRPLAGTSGFGGLITDALTRLVREPEMFRPGDASRLGELLCGLTAAMFTHELQADHLLPEHTRRHALALRIQAFALAHLDDPALSPAALAAAHHISVSYLHRIFRPGGLTPAAWIRHQRLERCRRDLADPALRHVPIHRVAARWGFPRAAEFSRAFRTAYGLPPRDHRATSRP